MASLGTGIISALTPDWVANKLWQLVLRAVEEAIVKENQCNPLFVLKEVSRGGEGRRGFVFSVVRTSATPLQGQWGGGG